MEQFKLTRQNIIKELHREKGAWGSRFSDNKNVFISVQADLIKFKNTIIGIEN